MSLINAGAAVTASWQQSRNNPNSGPTTQEGSISWSLAGLLTTAWTEVYHDRISLTTTNNDLDINLQALLNYINPNTFALTAGLMFGFKNLGDDDGVGSSVIIIQPGGGGDAFTGKFDGQNFLKPGDLVIWANNPTGTGTPVGAMQRIINASLQGGSGEANLEVVVFGKV